MRFIRQFLIILLVSFFGEVLKAILPLPIPASIYGLVIMLALLVSKKVKLHQVESGSMFLIDIMPLMFIPASAGLIDVWPSLKPVLIPLLIMTLVSTILVMAVSAKVTEFVIKFDKKVKKQDDDLSIEFKRTPDILKYVGEHKNENQIVVGFAAETNDLLDYAKEKIKKKNLDYIVANDISKQGIGFGSDDNEVYIITKNGNIKKVEKTTKENIAKELLDTII